MSASQGFWEYIEEHGYFISRKQEILLDYFEVTRISVPLIRVLSRSPEWPSFLGGSGGMHIEMITILFWGEASTPQIP